MKSGGFAGLIRGSTIDAAALAPTAAAVLRRLVKAALASRREAAKAKMPGVADVPVHQQTIETDAGTVHLSFDDLALPKSLKPLDSERTIAQGPPLAQGCAAPNRSYLGLGV